jgi:hypothetical protein
VLGLALVVPSSTAWAQFAGLSQENIGVGDPNADLIFTPVTPCRLIDTRLAGGAFVANETRNYDLIGPANYAGIGGNAAGCNIPGGTIPITPTTIGNSVRALVLNFVAVFPAGNGNLRAWPTNQAIPLASILNYAPALYAVANGPVVKTCDATVGAGNPCPLGDLSIRADTAGTDIVVDVLGYFTAVNYRLGPNRSLTGTFGIEYAAGGGGARGISTFSFHPPLAAPPAGVNIIQPGGASTANCPGTSGNPLAAPGQLCVYLSFAVNNGFQCVLSLGGAYSCGSANAFGSGLYIESTAAGQTSAVGSWAVTAP